MGDSPEPIQGLEETQDDSTLRSAHSADTEQSKESESTDPDHTSQLISDRVSDFFVPKAKELTSALDEGGKALEEGVGETPQIVLDFVEKYELGKINDETNYGRFKLDGLKTRSDIKSFLFMPPKSRNAYAVFTKFIIKELGSDFMGKSGFVRLSRAWRLLDQEALQAFEELKECDHKLRMMEWKKGAEEREKRRRKLCRALNVPADITMDELQGALERYLKCRETGKPWNGDDYTRRIGREPVPSTDRRMKDSEAPAKNKKTKQTVATKDIAKRKEREWEDERVPLKKSAKGLVKGGESKGPRLKSTVPMGSDVKPLKKKSSKLDELNDEKKVATASEHEWDHCWNSRARLKAINHGLDRIFAMAQGQFNFDSFGNDIIQCFYDVATVTGEPLRARALRYVEQLAQRWKYTTMTKGWKEGPVPKPREIIDVIVGMYCMERVGVHHDVKNEVVEFMKTGPPGGKGPYGALDYLGWDPVTDPPPDHISDTYNKDHKVSRFRALSTALIQTFYADRVGLDLGCSYADVIKWLPMFHPYRGPKELSDQEYIDQCYLITHVIFTLNNWGEMRLHPNLLPHEYLFIREHFPEIVRRRDIHLVGEFLEVLRGFGCHDDDVLIRLGLQFLLGTQEADGSWDRKEDTDDYTVYHATMVACQALLAHNYRGYGPGITELVPLLLSWQRDEIATHASMSEVEAKASTFRSTNAELFSSHSFTFPSGEVDLRLVKTEEVLGKLLKKKESNTAKGSSNNSVSSVSMNGNTKENAMSRNGEGDKNSDPVESFEEVVAKVKKLKEDLKAARKKKNWKDVYNGMKALKKVNGINFSVLEATGIGAVIMKLTDTENEQVVALSKKLVDRWKSIADEYIEEKMKKESEAAAARPAVEEKGNEVVLENLPAPCSLGELSNQVTSEAMEFEDAPQPAEVDQPIEVEAPEAMEVEAPETLDVEEMKDTEAMEE